MRSTRNIAVVAVTALVVGSCTSGSETRSARSDHPIPASADLHPTPVTCAPVKGRYTAAQLGARLPAVKRMLEPKSGRNVGVQTVGRGADAIEVYLLQGHEALADRLRRRFPTVVHVTIAGTEYCGVPMVNPRCPDLPEPQPLPPGLHLTLTIEDRTIHRGQDASGWIVMRNDAPTPLGWDTGQPLVGVLVRPGTRHVVGHYTRVITGTGFAPTIHSGESSSIRTFIGTTRCDGGIGSTLPSGTYGALAGVGPNEGPPTVFAPEVRIRIVK